MKKLLPFILLLFFLVGCVNVSNNNSLDEDDIMKEVYITEIERFNMEWDRIQFPIDLNEVTLREIKPIETNQTAIEIAKTIMEEFHKKGELSDYTLMSITHSTEDNIWCFEYSIDQQSEEVNNLIDCGCLYVAIDGSQGKLIKAWMEE